MTDALRGAALDPTVNGSHARHYIKQAAGAQNAIQRFQEDNVALRARVAELEAEVASLRARVRGHEVHAEIAKAAKSAPAWVAPILPSPMVREATA